MSLMRSGERQEFVCRALCIHETQVMRIENKGLHTGRHRHFGRQMLRFIDVATPNRAIICVEVEQRAAEKFARGAQRQ